MNIQNINSTQISFNAKIGKYLDAEIQRKKEYIRNNYKKHLIHAKINEVNACVNKIKNLFPSVNGSPITVDIGVLDKKHIKNNKLVKTRHFQYVIKSEDEKFVYSTNRDGDDYLGFFHYDKLISTLSDLSMRLAPWI